MSFRAWYKRKGTEIFGKNLSGEWENIKAEDPQSFEELGYGIGHDSKAVYAYSFENDHFVKTNLDSASFKIFPHSSMIVVADKNHVYYSVGTSDEEPLAQYPFERLDGVRTESFEILSTYFARQTDKVYRFCFGKSSKLELLDEIDGTSFQVSAACENIGWENENLIVADRMSDSWIKVNLDLVVHQSELRNFSDDFRYLVSDAQVYKIVWDHESGTHKADLLKESMDPKTLALTKIPDLVKDSESYFWSPPWSANSSHLKEIDTHSFEILSDDFARDKNAVYFFRYGQKLRVVLPNSLQIRPFSRLAKNYFCDDQNLYFISESFEFKKWEGAEVLSAMLIKDSCAVYYLTSINNRYTPIPTLDVKKFRLVPGELRMGTDGKNLIYVMEVDDQPLFLEGVDCETLVCLQSEKYFKDKDSVYLFEGRGRKKAFKKVEGADPKTFNPPFAADSDGLNKLKALLGLNKG